MTLVFGSIKIEKHTELEGWNMQNVEEFVYLGNLLSWYNDCSKDIKHRIGKATGALQRFRSVAE